MLANIRRFVYAIGMRPKPGTVLYSPAKAMMLAAQAGLREVDWGTLAVLDDGTKVTRKTLYEQMNYCPLCGMPLVPVVVDLKECPRECGRLHPDRDREGVPVITFEPFDENVPEEEPIGEQHYKYPLPH